MSLKASDIVTAGRPAAELPIDVSLVRYLLEDQHPDLAELPIEWAAGGWDNETFRLGEALAVRVPRREVGASLMAREQIWLPRLTRDLPLPAPVAVRLGTATDHYPWPWSVVPWLPGETADRSPPLPREATVLASFLKTLHKPAPPDAPTSPVRGIPLYERIEGFAERRDRLLATTDVFTPDIERVWETGLNAAQATEACWLHGDLHAQNVLVQNGRISAVIDWGDLCGGDPATDLAAIWSLLPDRSARETALTVYAPDQPLLDRGKAWAVMFATFLLDSGTISRTSHADMGRQMFDRLREDT